MTNKTEVPSSLLVEVEEARSTECYCNACGEHECACDADWRNDAEIAIDWLKKNKATDEEKLAILDWLVVK